MNSISYINKYFPTICYISIDNLMANLNKITLNLPSHFEHVLIEQHVHKVESYDHRFHLYSSKNKLQIIDLKSN